MEYADFVNRIVNDGIRAASESYKKSPEKKKGAVEGFEACRGKSPKELRELLSRSMQEAKDAYWGQDSDLYWEKTCFAAEVEWTCNCVSVFLMTGSEPPIVAPTARGAMKAAEVLGQRLPS